jgi:hypothetical protein
VPGSTGRGGVSAAEHLSVRPTGNLASTTGQAALEELQGDVDELFDAVAGAHEPVTLDAASSSWLTLVGQVLKLTLVAASDVVDGIVNRSAQTFAGIKSFASTIIASAGIQVATLFNTNGTSSGDRGVVVGFSTADGSVHSSAYPFSVATGVGGTPVYKFYVDKNGDFWTPVGAGLGRFMGTGTGDRYLAVDVTNGVRGYYAGYQWTLAGSGLVVDAPIVGSINLQLNTTGSARPTADAAHRGTFWYSKSAGGVADTVEVCLKSAGDTYSWVTIATG